MSECTTPEHHALCVTDAREALADALDNLATITEEFAHGCRATRDDVYMAEAKVHRARANLERALATATM